MTQARKLKIDDLDKTLDKDLRTLKRRAVKAARETAGLGRLVVIRTMPIAFGELFDGLIFEDIPDGGRLSSTAPHSAAVEEGSRPHTPPLAPILAWVRLRGLQGVNAIHRGATPVAPAAAVSAHIASLGDGISTPADAALRVARAIQMSIRKNGTKPTWFMRSALPEIEAILHREIAALYDEEL